ncbi:energy transducer TonB [Stakelama tenebrarum]|uniref:energy transducer TonB n=1 Tax=Stakelama tenebrarum TaxID=2711215 RepID=UPI001D1966AE|nr:energy transducer TonB [Sphingosinithalassobacter tenebrarum]
MIADRSRISPGSRAASFSAALAINGLMILGMIYAAPQIGILPPKGAIETYNVPKDPPPPDPIEQKVEPRPDTPVEQVVQPPIVTPDPIIPVEPVNPIQGTTRIPVELPPIGPIDNIGIPSGGAASGPVEPAPLPLVEAQVDPRYAENLQPDYPPLERRRGNEGVVVVRVLIGTDGRVSEVRKVRADSDAFYEKHPTPGADPLALQAGDARRCAAGKLEDDDGAFHHRSLTGRARGWPSAPCAPI